MPEQVTAHRDPLSDTHSAFRVAVCPTPAPFSVGHVFIYWLELTHFCAILDHLLLVHREKACPYVLGADELVEQNWLFADGLEHVIIADVVQSAPARVKMIDGQDGRVQSSLSDAQRGDNGVPSRNHHPTR